MLPNHDTWWARDDRRYTRSHHPVDTATFDELPCGWVLGVDWVTYKVCHTNHNISKQLVCKNMKIWLSISKSYILSNVYQA